VGAAAAAAQGDVPTPESGPVEADARAVLAQLGGPTAYIPDAAADQEADEIIAFGNARSRMQALANQMQVDPGRACGIGPLDS
jgi:hypothetical protein